MRQEWLHRNQETNLGWVPRSKGKAHALLEKAEHRVHEARPLFPLCLGRRCCPARGRCPAAAAGKQGRHCGGVGLEVVVGGLNVELQLLFVVGLVVVTVVSVDQRQDSVGEAELQAGHLNLQQVRHAALCFYLVEEISGACSGAVAGDCVARFIFLRRCGLFPAAATAAASGGVVDKVVKHRRCLATTAVVRVVEQSLHVRFQGRELGHPVVLFFVQSRVALEALLPLGRVLRSTVVVAVVRGGVFAVVQQSNFRRLGLSRVGGVEVVGAEHGEAWRRRPRELAKAVVRQEPLLVESRQIVETPVRFALELPHRTQRQRGGRRDQALHHRG
mmetsp:Transcript_45701/g.90090  ORF Transcript_45701/g.90090 Transcript_45701/m.90090 type:complete len:331 (-) Transcript_45701:816-1808(-)